jgi:hypothetical protein
VAHQAADDRGEFADLEPGRAARCGCGCARIAGDAPHGRAAEVAGDPVQALRIEQRVAVDSDQRLVLGEQGAGIELHARVIDTRKFELADGTVITPNVVVIAKLSVGGVVSASDLSSRNSSRLR